MNPFLDMSGVLGMQATLKFIEVKLRVPGTEGALSAEAKAVIITVLQRFQGFAPQELRTEVAVATRLAMTGHTGHFPEDIETEASDKYKEAWPSLYSHAGMTCPALGVICFCLRQCMSRRCSCPPDLCCGPT